MKSAVLACSLFFCASLNATQQAPLEQWMKDGDSAPLRWSVRIPPPQLSNHQRLLARFEIQVDGAELAKHRGRGELVTFVQVTGSSGKMYQNHDVINLEKMEEGISSSNVISNQYAFVVPGDYQALFAVYDSGNKEHWVKEEKFRVPVLKHDPFIDPWESLPAVEFFSERDAPETWYLPRIESRVHVDLAPARSTRIDVLVNLTPTEEESRHSHARDNELNEILPALKVIAQSEHRNADLNVAFLDLSRRRVSFQQKAVKELDWPQLRDSLKESDTNSIDVSSLQNRNREAQFFVSQVDRRIEPEEKAQRPCMLIVMTGPVAFASGEEHEPIETGSATCPVVYLRFHHPVTHPVGFADGRFGRRGGMGGRGLGGMPPRQSLDHPDFDQLAATLKPLSPHIFDIATPDQFRKALAYIQQQLRE